ncbi:MAG: hypothetical protein ABSC61_02940 [Anaerolineales bacterium]
MRSRVTILVLSIAFALLTLIPYLAAYGGAGAFRFTGFLFNPFDAASYLAKMRQGYDGQWLYHLAFTGDPGPGALLFTWYLLLGHLAWVFRLPLIVVWHIARMMGVAAFLVVAWKFFGRLTLTPRARAIAWAITALGSGFGFAAIVSGTFTSDLWVAEYIPFLGMITSAHFPLVTALLLLLLMRIVMPARKPAALPLFITAVIGMMLGALQPFAILPLGLALAVWIFWQRAVDGRFPEGTVAGLIAAGAGMLPWVVYDFWITRTLPNFASWFAQNRTPTPPVWDIALSLGLPGLVVAITVVRWLRSPGSAREKIRSIPSETLLLGLWLAINLVLLYAPFSLQRRLMLGMWIPLAALAAPKIEAWVFRPAAPIARGLIVAMTLVLTNLIFLAVILLAGLQHNPALFLSRDEAAAADWLNTNARGSVVLASPELSLWLPGMAGVRVVYGHPMETPNANEAKAAVEDYYSGKASNQLLMDRGVRYVVLGPREETYKGILDLTAFGKPIIFGSVSIYPISN